MILIIDNYDSFVYNLARYVGELNHEYQVKRNDSITLADVAALNPSHIIISPGPKAPPDAGISVDIIKHFAPTIPILGVCLGHQALACAFGGVVEIAPKPLHGKSSVITHHGKDIFANLPNPLSVGRYHSLIVAEKDLPDCLEVTARSEDNLIMALRHREYPTFGVQFHPESILTQSGHALLKNFLVETQP
jgi:anthranilate synthase component 2